MLRPLTRPTPPTTPAWIVGGSIVHAYWRQHQWPDFNVADGAISVGLVVILLDSFRRRP